MKKQDKVVIPTTIAAATEALAGIESLLRAKGWERAAIVYAFTEAEVGSNQHSGAAREVVRLPVREFARLGITGLSTQDTVRRYRSLWAEYGDPDIGPGDTVTLPDLGFPPEEQNLGSRMPKDVDDAVSKLVEVHGAEPVAEAVAKSEPRAVAASVVAHPDIFDEAERQMPRLDTSTPGACSDDGRSVAGVAGRSSPPGPRYGEGHRTHGGSDPEWLALRRTGMGSPCSDPGTRPPRAVRRVRQARRHGPDRQGTDMKPRPDHVAKVQDAIDVLTSRGVAHYRPDIARFTGLSQRTVEQVLDHLEAKAKSNPIGQTTIPWSRMRGNKGGIATSKKEREFAARRETQVSSRS